MLRQTWPKLKLGKQHCVVFSPALFLLFKSLLGVASSLLATELAMSRGWSDFIWLDEPRSPPLVSIFSSEAFGNAVSRKSSASFFRPLGDGSDFASGSLSKDEILSDFAL